MGAKSRIALVGLIGALILVFHSGFAKESTDLKSVSADIAKARLVRALSELEKRTQECIDLRVVLPKDALRGIVASREELRTALIYFNVKAENDCVKSEIAQYVVAAELVERVNADKRDNDSGEERASDLVMISVADEVEREAEYLRLPAPVREALEKIEALRRPFRLIDSVRALGLD
jgi:hypothetical protein